MAEPGQHNSRGGFQPAGTEDFSDEELCLYASNHTTDDAKNVFANGDSEWDERMSVKNATSSPHEYRKQTWSAKKNTSFSPSTAAARRDKQGTPLVSDDFRIAVCRGNLREVKSFLDRGVSVDVSLRAGWTALMYAASSGHANIVEFLLERGADVNYNKATYMYTPLIAAASSVHKDHVTSCVTILLEKGANSNVHERSHMTPIMFVSKSGILDAVYKLLEFGAQTDRQDNRGWTALCYAAEQGFTSVVKCLVDGKADTQKRCADGTASDIAYNHGHFELAEVMSNKVGTACDDTGTHAKSFHQSTVGGTELQQPDPSSLKQQQQQPLSQISGQRCDDLDLFLFGLDLGNLVPVFRQQSVNFPVLLRMSEKDLEKIGVDKYGWRCKIIDAVHEIHKKRWEPGSVRAPGKKILSHSESIALVENISKHVAYIGSSITYVGSNWTTHKTLYGQQQDPCNLDRLVVEIDTSLVRTAKLFEELKKLKGQLKEAVQSEMALPPDLILEPSDEPRFGRKLTAIIAVAAVTASIYVMYRSPFLKAS